MLINKVIGAFLCKKMRRLLYFSCCLLHTIQIHSANLEPPHPTEIIEKRQGAERWCEFAGNRQPLSMNHEDQPKKRRQKRDPQYIVRVTLTPRSLSVERWCILLPHRTEWQVHLCLSRLSIPLSYRCNPSRPSLTLFCSFAAALSAWLFLFNRPLTLSIVQSFHPINARHILPAPSTLVHNLRLHLFWLLHVELTSRFQCL